MNAGIEPQGEARQGWRILSELGSKLAERLNPGEIRINYQNAAEIMDEIAQVVPLYRNATHKEMDSGAQQYIDGLGPKMAARQAVSVPAGAAEDGGFTLITSRSLYTSYEAAAIHSSEADRLHREDSVKMNPADAAALGLGEGERVTISANGASVTAAVEVTAAVQARMVYLPLYYNGGGVTALFDGDAAAVSVQVSPA
jgi:predicted molibdopterin-dependent oxidoreductase YjgC